MPTSFCKKPFEFIVGFRVWIGVFFFVYFLAAMAMILIILSTLNDIRDEVYLIKMENSSEEFIKMNFVI